MSFGDAAVVIGRAIAGVILCASGLAVYNEGVVPMIRRRRMLQQWPSEEELSTEEIALLDTKLVAETMEISGAKSVVVKNDAGDVAAFNSLMKVQKPSENIIKSAIGKEKEVKTSPPSSYIRSPVLHSKVKSNNNDTPTQKQLEARKRVQEQLKIKTKMNTQRTNVNNSSNNRNRITDIAQQGKKQMKQSIAGKNMQDEETKKVRVYDWSSKFR